MKLARLGYTTLLWLLLPWIGIHIAWRALRQRAYLAHVGERFGFGSAVQQVPTIWIHAVSVGETRAAEPLVRALRQAHPGHRILLTHMTPTGRAAGAQLFGDRVIQCYLPYDFPFAVRRFLDRWQPALGVLLETEIWFNLIDRCRARGVPLYLANVMGYSSSAIGAAMMACSAWKRLGLETHTASTLGSSQSFCASR